MAGQLEAVQMLLEAQTGAVRAAACLLQRRH